MSSSLMVLSAKPEQILELDGIVKECNLSNMTAEQAFESAFRMAAGVQKLRLTITPAMMKDIMALQGTALGFRTDKDRDGGYPVEVVKDCAIEAVLRGFRLVGNEINIIAGRMYGTKEGFARLVREFEGITDLRLVPSVPKMRDGGALVSYRATWRFDAIPQTLEREFAVRVNSGMGADAIIGKATRKMLAAIYGQLTGSEHALPEGEVGDEILPQEKTAVSALNDSLPTPTKEAPAGPIETPPTSELAAEADTAFLDAEGISDVEAIRVSLAKRATTDAEREMLLAKASARADQIRASKKK